MLFFLSCFFSIISMFFFTLFSKLDVFTTFFLSFFLCSNSGFLSFTLRFFLSNFSDFGSRLSWFRISMNFWFSLTTSISEGDFHVVIIIICTIIILNDDNSLYGIITSSRNENNCIICFFIIIFFLFHLQERFRLLLLFSSALS